MVKITKPRTTKSLATMCARLAQNKLAENIVIMDLTNIDLSPSDYFVICSCNSDIQARTITDQLSRTAKEYQLQRPSVEGLENASWILIDFFDVVVHVMQKEARRFYQIEKLWGDAKFSTLKDDASLKKINLKEFSYDEGD